MLNNPLLRAIWEQSRVWLLVILLLLLCSIGLWIYQQNFVIPANTQLLQRKAALQQQLRARQAELNDSAVPVSAVEQMEADLQAFAELVPSKQKFADLI